MDIQKKRVLLIPVGVLTDGGGITDIHVKREILDKIRGTNISRVAIIVGMSDDEDYGVKVKTIEFFVFAYCKIAVSTHNESSDVVSDVMATVQHNIRKADLFLSVGEDYGVDSISVEDFIK